MRWKLKILAIALVLFISLSLASSKVDKISDEVVKKFDKDNRVNVVVKFNSNNVGGLKSMSSGKIIGEYGDLKTMSLTKSELALLESDPNVKKITLSHEIHAFLTESVPLINATAVWPLQSAGVNLTGLGQTICIIDSGINFSHPDLIGKNKTCIIDCFNKDCVENCSAVDDNGHGTHVAGIVAANGVLKGVAPGASLIGLKVLDSGGSGSGTPDTDLKSAIDWCVANRDNYNISVISMSLGTATLYSNYCDSSYASVWAEAINNATLFNISVVAASGNDGNNTAISSPACIQNASAIGDTYDANIGGISWTGTCNDTSTYADKIVCHANRNSLVKLFAPGALINSTWNDGKYDENGGTSMAAPHVAGAIALIKEYLNKTGRVKTPYQIENTLNNTGKIISDSSSGLNFSRINVYDAIISLDIDYPNVSLISPSNSIISDSVNQTFRCNATDLMLKNMTFYLWNSSSVYNSSYKELSDNEDSFEINITNINEGSYKWNCYYYDKNNNLGYYSSNYTLNISLLNINLVSPSNSSGIKQNQTFTCNASSNVGLSNVSFYLWNSTGLEYNVMSNITGLTNDSSISYNFTHEDKYDWNCLFMNNLSSQSYFSYNYTLYYDLTNPNVSLVSPSEGYSATGTQTVAFEFNVTDNINASSCDLILSGSNVSNNNSVRNGIGYISYSLNVGSYSWSINCTDYANNIGNSSLRTLTINQESSGGGSGGGGGGGGGGATNMVYSINNAQINEGYVKEIKKSDMIKFNLNTGGNFSNHSLTLTGLTNYSVNILVKSEPIELTLYVGEEKKVSVDSIDKYNLFVKLNSINLGKANLTIKQIDEGISVITPIENESIPLENKGNNKIFGESPSNYYWYAIPAIILLIFVGYFIRRFRKTRRKMPESKVPQHGANKRGLANI